MTGKQDPLVIVLGPTAIGKTGLAIELAQHLSGEIIGADSRQIYRWMDIGTAKPTISQQASVPHHLIDIVDPDNNLSLAEYQELAVSTVEEITARQCLPFLVGGTGQYLTAVEEGWSIPRVPPNEDLRAELESEAQRIGPEAFLARLAEVDPESAAKIHPNNVRRVIRALEVYLETGTPISILQRKQPPPWRIYRIGLRMARELLYLRADARVDDMMTAGFRDEVASLLERGYQPRLPSMSALGYREICGHLLDGIPIETAIQQTKNNTHDFIRKQEIWFRGHDNGIIWHNVEDLDVSAIIHAIKLWLQE